MFDAAMLVSDAMRDVDRRDGQHLADSDIRFNASFILGGQIKGEPPRLFRIYAQGNFIEASLETPYLQTGETKYGKPIIDWVITRSTSLNDAAKCVLVSFDSTMRSNLSVGMPIDLICYERDSIEVRMRRRFDEGDAYFSALGKQWSEGTRQVSAACPTWTGKATEHAVGDRGDGSTRSGLQRSGKRWPRDHLRARRQPDSRAVSRPVSRPSGAAGLPPGCMIPARSSWQERWQRRLQRPWWPPP